jgi:hypothetical protein
MISQYLKILIFVCSLLSCSAFSGYAQQEVYERHIQVSIRMMGHEVLLSSEDSSSRVLPIEKEVDRYGIAFENELQFRPEVLVATIDSVVKKTGIASRYIVEVEECVSGKVVYSYEIGGSVKQDLVPCANRMLPKACYRIFFTIVEPNDLTSFFYGPPVKSSKEGLLEAKGGDFLAFGIPVLALLLLIGLLLYSQKKKPKTEQDPDIASLGAYQFNKKSMELSFKGEIIELSSKEADLLMLLLNSVNSTVEREHILKTIWGDEGSYIGRTLDVFISKLRKRLEADTRVKIVNVRGVGYKLICSRPINPSLLW